MSYILNSLIFLLKAFIKSIILGLKNKYDAVQVHNMPDYLVFAAITYKLSGIPIILDIHDLTVELFKEKWGGNRYKYMKPLLILVEKLCVSFSTRVITVSEQCGNRLIGRGLSPQKLTIIMNVPNSEMFTFDTERKYEVIDDSLRLIYTGTVAERYGIHFAIMALSNVVKVIPNTIFEIYGNSDTEYDKYLKAIIHKDKLSDFVKFNGIVPYEFISDKLKKADIALVMSVNSEYTSLGIPTKIFEYANVGLPIIVTDLDSVRLVFGKESMCYVNTEDTDQIAKNIIELCKYPMLRKTMAENAYSKVRNFSGTIMNSRYLNLINCITN